MGAIDQLAERLRVLEEQAFTRAPRAARTTIVDGSIDQVETYDTGMVDDLGLPVYSTRVVSRIGRQQDGGNTVNVLEGPVPPAPGAFTVTPGPGTLTIKWDGTFKQGVDRPTDFYAVTVHLCKTSQIGSVVLPSAATLVGSVVAKDGDGLTIGGLASEEYTVTIVTVSQANKWSEPALPVKATPDDGSSLVAVSNAQIKAEQAYVLAGNKGKVYSQTSAPSDSSTPPPSSGDLWFNPSSGVLQQWTDSAWTSMPMDASQNIKANTITSSLLATQLVLASTIVAGPLNDSHAEISSSGIILYQKTADGQILASSRLGSTSGDDFIQVFSRTTGKVVTSLDQSGGITADKISTKSLFINGTNFDTYFSPLPEGIIAWGKRESNGAKSYRSETKYFEVQTVLQKGRLYRVTINSIYLISTANASYGVVALRCATGGNAVGLTSTQLQSTRTYMPTVDTAITSPPLTCMVNTAGQGPDTLEHRFLVSYNGEGPGYTYPVASSTFPAILTIEDLGPAINQVGIDFSVASPPTTKQNYTSYWKASASRTYQGGGAARSDIGGEMVQGYDPSGYNGNQTAMCLFTGGAYTSSNSAEVGKTVGSALSGATITAVDFFVKNHHFYYNSGGSVVYAPSTYTSLPASFTYGYGSRYSESSFAYGEARYVPAAPGQYTSLILCQGNGSNLSYYGRFDGADGSQPPVMRVSYTR